jgi:hypothetical protein
MLRVHVICEGQIEETFVQRILAKELTRVGVALTPSIIGKPGHKGEMLNINASVRMFVIDCLAIQRHTVQHSLISMDFHQISLANSRLQLPRLLERNLPASFTRYLPH